MHNLARREFTAPLAQVSAQICLIRETNPCGLLIGARCAHQWVTGQLTPDTDTDTDTVCGVMNCSTITGSLPTFSFNTNVIYLKFQTQNLRYYTFKRLI